MYIKHLHLENIGPFIEADLELMTDADDKPPVVLITGENGTGKSVILDAIRGLFGRTFVTLERDIRRKEHESDAIVNASFMMDGKHMDVNSFETYEDRIDTLDLPPRNYLSQIPIRVREGDFCPNWLVDYWPSTSASGSYKINSLARPDHRSFLVNALMGVQTKHDITGLICHFDYLRDSRDAQESATGERLYQLLAQIIQSSLLQGGSLSHIARTNLEPIIIQNGTAIGLANLSSGSAYLIQHLVNLLGRMYSVHYLRKTPLDELGQTPGLLIIDEAENQLHPKWQKRLLRIILDLFPNLQIAAATHSPFIISSVENARLFVCKAKGDHCVVVDETAEYSNKPVDEILMSPLFEETQPFNEEITNLLEARKRAIVGGDESTRERIETELKAINPEYFGYLDLDQLLAEVSNGKVHV